jgi:hypothetical protein
LEQGQYGASTNLKTGTITGGRSRDDYATCPCLCTNRAKYRRLDGTQWFELQATMDKSGKKYAYVELPVNKMKDGSYVFQFEIVDCFGQITSSRYYYFKVVH